MVDNLSIILFRISNVSFLIFVPYNILIVYCKAKYLTEKIDVFILPYKK